MPLKLAILTWMSTYSSYNIVKSEIIEEQNQKLEDEKKALLSQLEKQIELSGNVLYYAIIYSNECILFGMWYSVLPW